MSESIGIVGLSGQALVNALLRHTYTNSRGCKIWTRGRRNGYPVVRWHGESVTVAQLIWEAKVGPIPDGYILHHECEFRGCIEHTHHKLYESQSEHIKFHIQLGRQ